MFVYKICFDSAFSRLFFQIAEHLLLFWFFPRKIVKKILGEKLVKMLGVCQNWIFGQKFDFSNSVCKKQDFYGLIFKHYDISM